MLRLIQTSAKLCKASVADGLLPTVSRSPQLANSNLATPIQYHSFALPSGWIAPALTSCAAALNRTYNQQTAAALQAVQMRDMSKMAPKFVGGKLKPYSSYKERFKTTATGLIVYKRPGHRHKRFNKGPHRNRQLRRTQVLTNAYTATMQRLGFVSRHF